MPSGEREDARGERGGARHGGCDVPSGGRGSGGQGGVRVLVIGDPDTGKSSLIVALATEQFPENVTRVMPPTRLPADYFPNRIPITILDTSSSPEQNPKLIAECQAADAVVLIYACDRPTTLERRSSFWQLRRFQAPVTVVGCKLDLSDEQQVMAPIMQSFREIETCIECSALRQIQVTPHLIILDWVFVPQMSHTYLSDIRTFLGGVCLSDGVSPPVNNRSVPEIF